MPSCSAARMISVAGGDGDLLAVDRERHHRRAHEAATSTAAGSGASGQRPSSTCASYSSMKYCSVDEIGRHGAVGQRAERAEQDVAADLRQQRHVLGASVAVLDAAQDPLGPPRALAARRALAAGLVRVELEQPARGLDDAVRLIHDHARPGTEQRARRRDRLEVQPDVDVLGGEHRRGRTAGGPRLQLAAVRACRPRSPRAARGTACRAVARSCRGARPCRRS